MAIRAGLRSRRAGIGEGKGLCRLTRLARRSGTRRRRNAPDERGQRHDGSREAFSVRVIDDDAAVRESLEALLVVAGYPVASYASAEEYLCLRPTAGATAACFSTPHAGHGRPRPDAGARRPRAGSPPVLVLTASREAPLHDRARSLGARALLTKPVPQADPALDARQAIGEQSRAGSGSAARLIPDCRDRGLISCRPSIGAPSRLAGRRTGDRMDAIVNRPFAPRRRPLGPFRTRDERTDRSREIRLARGQTLFFEGDAGRRTSTRSSPATYAAAA